MLVIRARMPIHRDIATRTAALGRRLHEVFPIDPLDPPISMRVASGITIGSLGSAVAPLPPDIFCGVVFDRFQADPETTALAVVEHTKPIGLINRYDLIVALATPYGRALYANKPVTTLMDRAPLTVESSLDIDELEALIATERPNALMRGFIVTQRGHYVGVGSALSVLKLSRERTEQRSRELEIARAEAETSNRSKSQFLANMSHELRTPLNAIIGFAELIQLRAAAFNVEPRVLSYVDDIRSSGVHLLSIINDVLDMSKIEAGRMDLDEAPIDIEATMRFILRLVAERARTAELDIGMKLDADLPVLVGDERLVRQMLLNLVANAIKFTPRGGTIVIAASKRADEGIDLAVADTGIGIAPSHLELVVQPFRQVSNEMTRQHSGSGLGLSLVKAFSELHGGELTIESEVERGTIVTIRFPASRSVAIAVSREAGA